MLTRGMAATGGWCAQDISCISGLVVRSATVAAEVILADENVTEKTLSLTGRDRRGKLVATTTTFDRKRLRYMSAGFHDGDDEQQCGLGQDVSLKDFLGA